MSYFEPLQRELKNYLQDKDIELIHSAFLVSKEAHHPQTRQSGEPYITHPVAVATILANMHLDPATIMAALLHDVIEDTSISKEQLAEQFGSEVAELVDGVSKLTQINFETRAEAQAENFRKMFLAMANDIRVILIKLADRLHNMRTLEGLLPEKCRRVAKETLEIFAPIAHRLGMHTFRMEFERLGFAAYYPLRYRVLKKYVEEGRGSRHEMMRSIENSLRQCLKEADITVESISGREKELYSTYKKMHHRRVPLSDILDIYGFRIIVPVFDDCYRALGQVHRLYKPLPARFKDYIAIPKANGYQSLHTTLFGPYGVPIEIQIRTSEMDHVASSGIAAHWLYKSEDHVEAEAEGRINHWVESVLHFQSHARDSIEFLEHVKIDLFPDEVYVFTPTGSILKLPAGSTPIDFAYAVHTDLGDHCVGVKVDRQQAPLTTPLINGQTVEILINPDATPSSGWLDFVVTGKAKSSIRSFLKLRRLDEAVALGRRLLYIVLQDLGFERGVIPAEYLPALLLALHLSSEDELLSSIGMGERHATFVGQQLLAVSNSGANVLGKVGDKKTFSIKGTEGLVICYADCCAPIPGDPIIAYLEEGQGIVVHQVDCSHLKKSLHDQRMSLSWSDDVHGQFKTYISVHAPNEPGIIGALALALAQADAHIENISASAVPGDALVVKLEVSVHDRAHLALTMQGIEHIKTKQPIHVKRVRFD